MSCQFPNIFVLKVFSNKMITKNKSILITGATGSFGKCFVKEALKKNINLKE